MRIGVVPRMLTFRLYIGAEGFFLLLPRSVNRMQNRRTEQKEVRI